jgi:hypothetical protein
VSKSAWRSNLTASLSHHCRDRPIADTVRLINMLRCSLSLRPFVHGAAFLLAGTSVCGQETPFAYVEHRTLIRVLLLTRRVTLQLHYRNFYHWLKAAIVLLV